MTTFVAGYQWAKAALTDGASEETVEVLSDANGIDPTVFDQGARAALKEHREEQAAK